MTRQKNRQRQVLKNRQRQVLENRQRRVLVKFKVLVQIAKARMLFSIADLMVADWAYLSCQLFFVG